MAFRALDPSPRSLPDRRSRLATGPGEQASVRVALTWWSVFTVARNCTGRPRGPGRVRALVAAPRNAAHRQAALRKRLAASPGGLVTRTLGAACRPELVALGLLVIVGLGLRVYFVSSWRPALVGFPDSGIYVEDAITGVFRVSSSLGGEGRVGWAA